LAWVIPGPFLVGSVGATVTIPASRVISIGDTTANSVAFYLDFIESTEGECKHHVVMLDLSGNNL